VPEYLYGSFYPGGKVFNPAAFTPPPVNSLTGLPIRQGDLGRNALRGFWRLPVGFLRLHRDFPIHELLKVQFRAEMFKRAEPPPQFFAQPIGDIFSPQFGQSTPDARAEPQQWEMSPGVVALSPPVPNRRTRAVSNWRSKMFF